MRLALMFVILVAAVGCSNHSPPPPAEKKAFVPDQFDKAPRRR